MAADLVVSYNEITRLLGELGWTRLPAAELIQWGTDNNVSARTIYSYLAGLAAAPGGYDPAAGQIPDRVATKITEMLRRKGLVL